MSSSRQPNFDLPELLLRALKSEATQDELTALNEALQGSEQLRSEAVRFLSDDSLLSDFFTAPDAGGDVVRGLIDGVTLSRRSTTTDQPQILAQSRNLGWRVLHQINQHGLAVAVAASLIIACLGVYTATITSELADLYSLTIVSSDGAAGLDDSEANKLAAQEKPDDEVIGRVSGLQNPVWGSGVDPLNFGDRLRRGQSIKIESGVLELLLSTGAKVTIEGPAQFETNSALETYLTQGRLAAAAPRMARGYTVITPTAELVDIGTQFGVVVEDDGESELHVFDGDVVARSRGGANKPGSLIHAKQDEAMRFVSSSTEPERIAFGEQVFVRQVTPQYKPSDLPALPTNKKLVQWYAADMCKNATSDGSVGVWGDLLVGDNDFADNAWQFDEVRRPKLVEDGAGRRALRFDGWATSLATSPMEPVAKQTVFVVCMPAPIAYENQQILYKYGDAPSLELLLRSDAKACGWVWPGPGQANVGEVLSKPVDNEQPIAIAYQYDSDNNVSKLWLNGELQGTSTAPVPVLESGQRFIGSHADPNYHRSYFGNIYELVVFDRVFEQSDIEEFWAYFSKRYHLDPASHAP
jgi:hypothetical protein